MTTTTPGVKGMAKQILPHLMYKKDRPNENQKIKLNWWFYFKNAVFTVLNPSYWIMNNPYNKSIDIFLCEALNKGFKVYNYDGYTADIENVTFWVENHPYAQFTVLSCLVRPSRLMVKLANDALISSVPSKVFHLEKDEKDGTGRK